MTACAELAHNGKGRLKEKSQVPGLHRGDGDIIDHSQEDGEKTHLGNVGRSRNFT